ncbi:hypothetical protein ACWE42_11860 [Sutcliffiella cohnii]|uniref:Uncharacterized protein n=1 Tax=Sutcliffiella cohnii TaxID=33932 RepID=A0A223KP10_9BACI|nr:MULTISPECIES: hypothetical protein [Sutcliffiella]AST91127.1 hypothetical protein BC6307_07460 [Sutcliffiella cohnii]WBL16927.1 hypothetical protein O1A01_09960 [Sutcliffiella sp. NC1]
MEIFLVSFIITSLLKKVSNNRHSEQGFIERLSEEISTKLGNQFLSNVVRQELYVLYFSLFVWFQKGKKQSSAQYTYHISSQIKTIVIVFGILIFGEGMLFHFLLQKWSEVAAWILTALNIYGLLYLVGLYNSVKHMPHEMSNGRLIIRLGFQSSIDFDLTNIAKISKAKALDLGEKVPSDMYYSLLNIDSPQYEIMLHEPVEMTGMFGKKKFIKRIVCRMDEPERFLEDIEK